MTVAEFQIRSGGPADLAAIAAIERASFGDPWSPAALLQELTPSPLRLPLVAFRGAEVVGYLMAWRSADQLHILNLAVSPAWRRCGVGARLLQAALAEAASCELAEVTLEVRPGNAAALALYGSYGFRSVGVRQGYYADTGEDALILTRALQD